MSTGASVTQVVRAPIDKVWQRFRAFGPEVKDWWDIYQTLQLEPPGQDEVGVIRAFTTKTGRSYKERLEVRDDQNHVMKYSLVEANPALPVTSALTTIEMSAKNESETVVHWSSDDQFNNPVVAGSIITAQTKAYTEAIQCLDHSFNPNLGILEVEIISATNLIKPKLFLPDAYVVISLDADQPQESKVVHHSCLPVWKEKFSFDIFSNQGQLQISLWDANLGRDEFLGSATINLHRLVAGQEKREILKLQQVDQGEIQISSLLKLKSGNKELPATKEMEIQEAINFLSMLLGYAKNQLLQIVQQLPAGIAQKYEYERYPRRKDAPELALEKLPRMVKGLPPGQALTPKKMGLFTERITEYVQSEIAFVLRLEKILKAGGDPWTAYFAHWVTTPSHVPEFWKDDVEFCRQLIQGVNPMLITLCIDIRSIPQDLLHLSAQGKSLQELIQEKRLFLLDYKELVDIPQHQGKVFYAPYVLVYRELLEDDHSRLNLLGIQLTRNPDKNEIYTPDSPQKNKYLFAKMHAQCADDQYHQFVFHLALTHLVIEPFVISHHNVFPTEHPIGQILAPHFQDTLGINYLARQTLVSPVAPFTDRTFATGTSGGLQLVLKMWESWDFWGTSFPEQLRSRGFDEAASEGVEDFYFRDDGFKIWNAYLEYTTHVVNAIYANDAAVGADQVIQAWAEETADPERAAIPGFPPKIETRELLARTLINIIFIASAQHSAINFSQYQSLGYVPNRPNVLFKEMPESSEDINFEYIQSALQSFPTAHFQVFFSNLLSTPSLHPLPVLSAPQDPRLSGIHEIFMAKLNLISVEIAERDKQLTAAGKPPYPYLSPINIASSIDT